MSMVDSDLVFSVCRATRGNEKITLALADAKEDVDIKDGDDDADDAEAVVASPPAALISSNRKSKRVLPVTTGS